MSHKPHNKIHDNMTESEIVFAELEKLKIWSVESKLDKSLKKSLRYFNKSEILLDVTMVSSFLRENARAISDIFPMHPFRIKSLDSCTRKYAKFSAMEGFAVNKTFNDLLGFRVVVQDYPDFSTIDGFDVVDLRNGKSLDDGYRGIHMYYAKSSRHYPVEVQFHTKRDSFLNVLLHEKVYKYHPDPMIGRKLKEAYDSGKIDNEETFAEVLFDVLSNC